MERVSCTRRTTTTTVISLAACHPDASHQLTMMNRETDTLASAVCCINRPWTGQLCNKQTYRTHIYTACVVIANRYNRACITTLHGIVFCRGRQAKPSDSVSLLYATVVRLPGTVTCFSFRTKLFMRPIARPVAMGGEWGWGLVEKPQNRGKRPSSSMPLSALTRGLDENNLNHFQHQ